MQIANPWALLQTRNSAVENKFNTTLNLLNIELEAAANSGKGYVNLEIPKKDSDILCEYLSHKGYRAGVNFREKEEDASCTLIVEFSQYK